MVGRSCWGGETKTFKRKRGTSIGGGLSGITTNTRGGEHHRLSLRCRMGGGLKSLTRRGRGGKMINSQEAGKGRVMKAPSTEGELQTGVGKPCWGVKNVGGGSGGGLAPMSEEKRKSPTPNASQGVQRVGEKTKRIILSCRKEGMVEKGGNWSKGIYDRGGNWNDKGPLKMETTSKGGQDENGNRRETQPCLYQMPKEKKKCD